MKTNIFKLGDDLLQTNASERQLNAIIKTLRDLYNEGYNIYDVLIQLQKRNFTAEIVYINTNIKW
ncbi:hypothetical protein [Bacillus thuringiensis]|uniref:hypothetical protein n=1 Tax=Bacillus thuringiensis TaxID=1428 RepID=UPI0026E43D9C|nr:hypothetical protein [Bacillus thuringiensis]MDO6628675.1 hypothetical protein [Bacillus thuringiensis]MDO6659200.1 hypothetical protein [Bacillus thuringiensis]MDO6698782.1 hypothetical protein [Bacillus thuringiensis]